MASKEVSIYNFWGLAFTDIGRKRWTQSFVVQAKLPVHSCHILRPDSWQVFILLLTGSSQMDRLVWNKTSFAPFQSILIKEKWRKLRNGCHLWSQFDHRVNPVGQDENSPIETHQRSFHLTCSLPVQSQWLSKEADFLSPTFFSFLREHVLNCFLKEKFTKHQMPDEPVPLL